MSGFESPSLKTSKNSAKLMNMNAAEILEEISRLPPEEKGKIVEFLRDQPNAETLEAMRESTDGLPRASSVEALFEELSN